MDPLCFGPIAQGSFVCLIFLLCLLVIFLVFCEPNKIIIIGFYSGSACSVGRPHTPGSRGWLIAASYAGPLLGWLLRQLLPRLLLHRALLSPAPAGDISLPGRCLLGRISSGQHSHHKVYIWLQIELPLFHFGVRCRRQIPSGPAHGPFSVWWLPVQDASPIPRKPSGGLCFPTSEPVSLDCK